MPRSGVIVRSDRGIGSTPISGDGQHVSSGCYGSKRESTLKRADLVAFIERIVVIPRMAPVTSMFRFPSWLTDRSRLAAFSGVSEAGVVPESIGTAPSGASAVRALPWITLAR